MSNWMSRTVLLLDRFMSKNGVTLLRKDWTVTETTMTTVHPLGKCVNQVKNDGEEEQAYDDGMETVTILSID